MVRSWLVVERLGELAELLTHDVELVLLLGDLEEGPRVDLGDLFHLAALPQGREVELRQRLFDEPTLVVLVEGLAGDRLGGGDREVGDLLADLLDGAAGLGLDVAAGLLQQLLTRLLGGLEALTLRGLRRLAGAGDDLLGLAREPP